MTLELKTYEEFVKYPEKYKKYAEKGVFFFVHPGFTQYFSKKNDGKVLDKIYGKNEIIHSFKKIRFFNNSDLIKSEYYVKSFDMLKEYLFLESLKEEGNLTFLALPKNYKNDLLDYSDFISEVTENQENFLIMETLEKRCGYVYLDSIEQIHKQGVKTAFLGGGYLFYCLHNLNFCLAQYINDLKIVPEAVNPPTPKNRLDHEKYFILEQNLEESSIEDCVKTLCKNKKINLAILKDLKKLIKKSINKEKDISILKTTSRLKTNISIVERFYQKLNL